MITADKILKSAMDSVTLNVKPQSGKAKQVDKRDLFIINALTSTVVNSDEETSKIALEMLESFIKVSNKPTNRK